MNRMASVQFPDSGGKNRWARYISKEQMSRIGDDVLLRDTNEAINLLARYLSSIPQQETKAELSEDTNDDVSCYTIIAFCPDRQLTASGH
jgi:F420-0:gamma-glutamyl ligase-like protein